MAITAMDGYPDDPWIEKLSDEMNQLVTDAEKRIANAPEISSRILNNSLFMRDIISVDYGVFKNDPYKRVSNISLN